MNTCGVCLQASSSACAHDYMHLFHHAWPNSIYIYACMPSYMSISWAEAHIKIARMTLTVKLDRNWSSFQLANSAPPLSVTDSAIAPSARMHDQGGKVVLLATMVRLWDVLLLPSPGNTSEVTATNPAPLLWLSACIKEEAGSPNMSLCLASPICLIAAGISSRHVETCTSSPKLQCEDRSSRTVVGSEIVKTELKDHCSRDPVQVQSGQWRRVGRGWLAQ